MKNRRNQLKSPPVAPKRLEMSINFGWRRLASDNDRRHFFCCPKYGENDTVALNALRDAAENEHEHVSSADQYHGYLRGFLKDAILAIMACAMKTRTSGARPNEIATVRYLRRALAIERR